jgi:hypothetical protein
MQGTLLQQQVDGDLAKHLLFMSMLNSEQQVVTTEVKISDKKQECLENQSAQKMMVRFKPSSKISQWQKVTLSNDAQCEQVIASYNDREIELGMGFAAVHTPKAFVTVTQPR